MATDLTTRPDETATAFESSATSRAQLPRSGCIQKPGVSRTAAPPQVEESSLRTPKAFHNHLLPDISLVVFNVVLPQKTQELILKRFRAVMFLLIADVLLQTFQMRRTHRKSPVSSLPLECLKLWRQLLQPLRRIAFGFTNKVCHRDRPAELTKNVNVVFRAAHDDRWRILLATCSHKIRVQCLANVLVLQKRFPFASRENNVQVNLGERLSHVRFLLWNAFGVRAMSDRYLGWRRVAADPGLLDVTASRYSRRSMTQLASRFPRHGRSKVVSESSGF